jgi:hypothetical protein
MQAATNANGTITQGQDNKVINLNPQAHTIIAQNGAAYTTYETLSQTMAPTHSVSMVSYVQRFAGSCSCIVT